MGGSAGSVVLLFNLFKKLSENFPYPLIIVVHRPNEPNSEMRSIFQSQCKLQIIEPKEKTAIENNKIYLAPPGVHLIVEEDFSLNIDNSPLVQFSKPSIDVLFMTAAETYKENLTGILVTGTNRDGAIDRKSVV